MNESGAALKWHGSATLPSSMVKKLGKIFILAKVKAILHLQRQIQIKKLSCKPSPVIVR